MAPPARSERAKAVTASNRAAKKALEQNAAMAAPETEQEQPNAVLVQRIEGEDGQLSVEVQTVGNVRITEIETVLKLGLKLIKDKFGVE